MQQAKIQKGQKVKTKVRFTSLDVAAMVAELQALVGLRVSNIYDLNPTTYFFKIAKSEEKFHLLVQNGVRFHLTQEKPDKKVIPSGFTMKFRKFLRSKRIENIRQVGVERVVVISFGSEAYSNHLILQLYSQGNIILTDSNYRILQCIRSHQFNDKVKTAVGQIYPFQYAANIYIQNIDVSPESVEKYLSPITIPVAVNQTNNNVGNKKKGKQQSKGLPKLKDIVFKLIPCLFPLVIEHILAKNNIDPETKLDGQDGREKALNGGKICLQFLKNYLGKKQSGYIYSKGEQYFQFSAYQNCKLQKWTLNKFQSFGSAVTEYFKKYKRSSHEQQEAFQEIAWKKYQQIKKDQQVRVKKLIEEQQTFGGKAQLIEKNIDEVEAILKIIGTMENNGYSWEAMERMVAESRKTGDPLANMIHSFNAVKRQITILLSDAQNQQAHLCALIPVQILIDYNAYTNATMYYQGRKKHQQKEQRTRQASQQVLKIAQKDALKKIQKKKNQILLKAVPTRKQLWFQKFYWFVSLDGWLIISGRDSHQNQLLVKRYMKTGDLYMHSDYGGAASTIIKGPPKAGIAPLTTLQQAAVFTVCRSKAWDTKIISSAWWVYHDQVSKSAPTGQFLPTGSFMIRGKRNYLHPNRMQMGLTLLFKLDNQSMFRKMEHKKILDQESKSELSNDISLQRNQSETLESQQFAIIDLQAQARLAKQKKREKALKGAKGKNQKGKEGIELIKKSSNAVEQKVKESDEQEGSNSDQEDKQQKQVFKKDQKKGDKKNDKKQSNEDLQPQQKHKNRNKKKLKKLQKYLQEQDEDQRQIIMKMLGAKQMKHLQDEQQQQQKQKDKKNDKKDKKLKKKGIHKYLNVNEEEGQAIDTDKVLFLKEKQPKYEKPVKQQYKIQNNSNINNNKQNNQKKQSVKQPKQPKQTKQSSQVKQIEEQIKQQTNKQHRTEQQNLQKLEQAAQNKEGIAEQQVEKQEKQNQQINQSDDEQAEVEQKIQQKQEQIIDDKIIDSQLSELHRLSGKILGADKWDALIPMCAPYHTIKDNKFKVKLVPGGLKKGKAARSILNYFTTIELDQNEKAFVRALPQQQVINALIGNIKLAGAGLLKIQQKSKAQKKVKRKEDDKKKQQ